MDSFQERKHKNFQVESDNCACSKPKVASAEKPLDERISGQQNEIIISKKEKKEITTSVAKWTELH